MNPLVAVVQHKRLFQGNIPLVNFITKFTLLVDEAQYPAAMKERVIWDTLISGISCEKTHDKITRKGGNVTLKEVKDIPRKEYSIKLTTASMNGTVKANVNYLKYDRNHGKGKRKGRKISSNQSQVLLIKELFQAKVQKLPNQSVIAVEKASTHQDRSALP